MTNGNDTSVNNDDEAFYHEYVVRLSVYNDEPNAYGIYTVVRDPRSHPPFIEMVQYMSN